MKVTTLCDFEVMKQKTPLNYRSTTQQVALIQKASSLNEKKIVEVSAEHLSQFRSAKTEDWVQLRIQHKKLTLHNIIDVSKQNPRAKILPCLLEQEKEKPTRVLESRITRNYQKRLELVIGNDPGKAIPKDPVTNPKKPKSTQPSSIL